MPEDRTIRLLCTRPDPEDVEFYELSKATRALVTLKGTERQLWLSKITIIERNLDTIRDTIQDLSLLQNQHSSAPPVTDVGSVNTTGCKFFSGQRVVQASVTRRMEEPCGLSSLKCCEHMLGLQGSAYEVNDAGCCDVLFGTNLELSSNHYTVSSENGWWTQGAGMGYYFL